MSNASNRQPKATSIPVTLQLEMTEAAAEAWITEFMNVETGEPARTADLVDSLKSYTAEIVRADAELQKHGVTVTLKR